MAAEVFISYASQNRDRILDLVTTNLVAPMTLSRAVLPAMVPIMLNSLRRDMSIMWILPAR